MSGSFNRLFSDEVLRRNAGEELDAALLSPDPRTLLAWAAKWGDEVRELLITPPSDFDPWGGE